MRKLGYSIGPEKKPHSLMIQQGTKVTPLLLLFHYCAQILSASVPRQPTGKWGLPNQPSQSRRQPMRDLTKLGFADDLALVAGLEEVGRTCCPQINFIRCLSSSLGRGKLMKSLTLSTTKIWGTSLIIAEREISSWTRRSSIWSAVKCHSPGMLSPKHQYSNTSVRVTQTKAKEMHLEMDLALYWCS